MSHLLELIGRGLDNDLSTVLARYFWSPPVRSVEQLEDRCQQHPDWPDIRLQLGLAYLRGVQLDEAIEHLSQACRRKPDYLAARLALASAYEEKGDPAGALVHLKIASQYDHGEVRVLFAAGYCYEKLGKPETAAEYYRDAIGRDPGFVPARERLAAIGLLLGDLDDGIAQYQAILQARPEEGWVRSALAHLYYRNGQYDLAVEEFERAIAMEPENWALMDDEVEALVAAGHIREGLERLHLLIEQQGSFADLYLRLGDLYSKIGDDKSAMNHYLQALEIQPNYLEATVKLGTHHLVCGRWDEAAEAFHQACELNDRTLVNYVGVGVAQAAAGKHAEAMNSFDLAAAVEPNSTLLLAEMARLQLKVAVAEEFANSFAVGQNPSDEVDLDNDHLLHKQIDRHAEQIERHPRHPDARYRYGVLLRSEGRLGEAMEQFKKAVEINPSYVQAIIKLGITQQELGLMEEAVETFKQALDIKPEYVDLHYRLGLLHTDRRQFEQAVRDMEEAAAGAPDNEQIRAALALSLQNMGLMDRAAATWRSLWRYHRARA